MKIVLVLCALVAVVYCDPASVFIIENCIGINHDPSYRDKNGYLITELNTSFEICCTPGFKKTDTFTGFSSTMKKEDVKSVVHKNFAALSKGRKSCQERESPKRAVQAEQLGK